MVKVFYPDAEVGESTAEFETGESFGMGENGNLVVWDENLKPIAMFSIHNWHRAVKQ